METFQDNYKLLLAECERETKGLSSSGKLVAVWAVLCRGKEGDGGYGGLTRSLSEEG